MSTSLAEINVVPLVDVMLVLLIIFMVTAPMMTQGLPVNLPQARRAQPVTAQPIYVTIPPRSPASASSRSTTTRCAWTSCRSGCGRRCSSATDKSVFVRGDGRCSMQDLMYVMDRLKEGGVEKVGLADEAARQR